MFKPTSSNPQTGCHGPRCYLNTSCYVTLEPAMEPSTLPTPMTTHAQVVKETSNERNSMHSGLELRLSMKEPIPLVRPQRYGEFRCHNR